MARSAANQGLPVPSMSRAPRIKTSILVAVMGALLFLIHRVLFFMARVKNMPGGSFRPARLHLSVSGRVRGETGGQREENTREGGHFLWNPVAYQELREQEKEEGAGDDAVAEVERAIRADAGQHKKGGKDLQQETRHRLQWKEAVEPGEDLEVEIGDGGIERITPERLREFPWTKKHRQDQPQYEQICPQVDRAAHGQKADKAVMHDYQQSLQHIPAGEVQRTIPGSMRVDKGQRIMKLAVAIGHKQNDTGREKESDKDVEANAFQKPEHLVPGEQREGLCSLPLPDPAKVFITEWYGQIHAIRAS